MPEVTDNAALCRFEMAVEGRTAFVAYRRSGPTITLLHAEVPRELEGRGIGTRLVRATLEAVRGEGRKVVPRCPFVARIMRESPEFADLLA